jgi:hypothetical protein
MGKCSRGVYRACAAHRGPIARILRRAAPPMTCCSNSPWNLARR